MQESDEKSSCGTAFIEMNRFVSDNFEDSEGEEETYRMIGTCVGLRNKYISRSYQDNDSGEIERASDYRYDEDGVFSIKTGSGWFKPAPCRREYFEDSKFVIDLSRSGDAVTLCFRRLENLKYGFMMYRNMFSDKEKKKQMSCSQSDYYKVVKVDTHVHHSACMNSKHFLKFLKSKLEKNSDEIVYVRDGIEYTLAQVFDNLRITSKNLLIDVLNTHAHTDTFHRFDRFNKKYNPYGKPILREIFLKYDNVMKGRFLAEISKEVFHMQEEQKYYYSEYRVSIYGKSAREWDTLSEWIVDNELFSSHVKWIIQIPRVFNILREKNVSNFGEVLKNIFAPLFEVTKDEKRSPKLARLLKNVVAFDSVDDESIRNNRSLQKLPVPDSYTHPHNPPYSYYLYYIYANVASLNAFRKSNGLNVFSFRPHSGEAGDLDNLIYAFLVSQSISHGLNLRKSLVTQYLYYICQVGISMSPLSNNALFLRLKKNPFFDFFMKGLCICLSTDDPLQFHFTKEPLAEEYSIATQFWMLSSCDQCEVARNSVLISNFEDTTKKRWIGENYKRPFVEGNDLTKTNIPNVRLRFRELALSKELSLIGRSMSDIFR